MQANRRNSQGSTGPRTAEGKLRVSKNSVKHGLLSKDVIVKGESEIDFMNFRQSLYLELAPVGQLEQLLADRIIASFWRLKRVGKIGVELLSNLSSFQTIRPAQSSLPVMNLTKTYEDGSTEIVSSGASAKEDSDDDVPDDVSLGRAVHADFAGSNTLGKFRRYEAHIDRTLYKALHELQRLQSARLGYKVSAPLAIDVNVSRDDR